MATVICASPAIPQEYPEIACCGYRDYAFVIILMDIRRKHKTLEREINIFPLKTEKSNGIVKDFHADIMGIKREICPGYSPNPKRENS